MNGIIVVNKPQDFTSFDAVAIMRGCCRTKKVGHSGTLDPMATGVLPVFIGTAAKAVSLLPESGKSYRAEFRLGVTSDTLDIWGKLSTEKPVDVDKERLSEVLEKFRGDIMQVPPMYSALKVDGKKLCDLARQGIEVERKPRPVTIYRLELLDFDGKNGTIEVDCSSGTYIRTLVDDIGRELGTGAVMTALMRTKACGFDISESVPLTEIKTMPIEQIEALVKPVDSVFAEYPRLELDEVQVRLYKNGVRLDSERLHSHPENDRLCRVYDMESREFLGLAKITDGELVSVKRF